MESVAKLLEAKSWFDINIQSLYNVYPTIIINDNNDKHGHTLLSLT